MPIQKEYVYKCNISPMIIFLTHEKKISLDTSLSLRMIQIRDG